LQERNVLPKNKSLFFCHPATAPIMPYGYPSIAHLAEETREIVGALTLPEVFKEAPRYNGPGSGKATVAKTLRQEFNLTWSNATATTLPANETQIFVFRNLLRALVYFYRQCPAYTYTWNAPQLTANWFLFQTGTTILNSGVWADRSIALANPHGAKLFPGYGKGQYGLWVNNDGVATTNFTIVFTVAGVATAPGAGTIIVSRFWTGKDWDVNQVTTLAAQTAFSHTAPVGGAYMYWEVRAPAAGLPAGMVCAISTNCATASDVWAHRAVDAIDALLPLIEGGRVNGGVAWIRNDSPVQYEQGRIIGVDVAKSIPWSNINTGSASLLALDEPFSGSAKLGAYGFLTPDDDEDFTMSNDICSYTGPGSTLNLASFPLDERSTYISMAVAGANDATNSRSFTLITYHMIEYYSNSPVNQREISRQSPDSWQAATEFMKNMEQFYENKFHVDMIFDAIARYGGPLSQAAAEILDKFPQTAFLGNALKSEGFQGAFKRLGSAAAEAKEKRRKK
jgi:hypothetical protein